MFLQENNSKTSKIRETHKLIRNGGLASHCVADKWEFGYHHSLIIGISIVIRIVIM